LLQRAGNPVATKPKAYIEEFKVTEDTVFLYFCLEIKRAAWGGFHNWDIFVPSVIHLDINPPENSASPLGRREALCSFAVHFTCVCVEV